MIQRIQSLYLFLGTALLSACLFLPIWKAGSADGGITLEAFDITAQLGKVATTKSFPYIGLGLLLTILLSLYIILQFKNRGLQMKLCLLNALLLFGVMGLMYWGSKEAEGLMLVKIAGDYTIAFFFPSLAILLNLMAMRSIKKDEELVRSADRIR